MLELTKNLAKLLSSVMLFFAFSAALTAQKQYTPFAFSEKNEAMQALCTETDPTGWLHFKPETALTAQDFFTKNGDALGLGRNDEFRAGTVQEDEYGSKAWFHHYYKGIPVEGSAFMLSSQNGKLRLAHGKFVEKLNLDIRTGVGEEKALASALAALEINDKEYKLSRPTEKAIAYAEISDLNPNNYFYCYRFAIERANGNAPYDVYINVATGKFLKKSSGVALCNHAHKNQTLPELSVPLSSSPFCAGSGDGHAYTLYNGYQGITTSVRSAFGYYELFDASHGIQSWNNTGTMPNISSCSNDWTTWREETTALYGAQRTYDYYNQKHGRPQPREGTKFNPSTFLYTPFEIHSYNRIHYPQQPYYEDGTAYEIGYHRLKIYKETENSGIQTTVDIIGHEISHAVMSRQNGNNYEFRPGPTKEAGTLNESFADIFGTCIEYFAGGETFDWDLGENTGIIARSMSNPGSHNDASTYGGTFWIDPNSGSDNGGIHHNSGVQNKWFYLLSQGGAQNGTTVTGLGIDNAAKIAYRNMAVYAQNQWNFNDARNGSIQAAIDIFGICSNEVRQTRNAWKAVGVGNNTDNNIPCLTLSGYDRTILHKTLTRPNTTASYTASVYPPSSVLTYSTGGSGWSVVQNGSVFNITTNRNDGTLTVIATNAGVSRTATRSITYEYLCATCPQRTIPKNNKNEANELIKTALSISPNPSSTEVKIHLEGLEQAELLKTIEITNIQGISVGKFTFSGSEFRFPTQDLANGVYLLRISDENINITEKIIVQHN